MTDEEITTKINEYREREIRWTDNSLSQLSFFNSLLLTLGVGFLSFSYENFFKEKTSFSICNLDWNLTFTAISIFFIFLSIYYGLIVSINRLYSFRITRYINRTRHLIMKHSGLPMPEGTTKEFNKVRKLFLTFEVMIGYPKITFEQCKTYKILDNKEEVKSNFNELRNIAHNLGINTWRNTNYQIVTFFLSVFFYILSILFN
ncbi:hypothetical protein AMR72_02300 [Flavobacterium psychrophilum]|nr:hypothetical protein AMR72_02300 [Flavobacterium psychrophilum]AOE51455.1 hypothetical protein ALW18_02300 [Flavobacterium psychrophilum]